MSITKYDTVADPKDLDWSEHPITFPLVLDPTIRNVRFKKVLIDCGSALNILFARALTELGLIKDDLVPIDSPFWGIVPGRASQPLGHITLPV